MVKVLIDAFEEEREERVKIHFLDTEVEYIPEVFLRINILERFLPESVITMLLQEYVAHKQRSGHKRKKIYDKRRISSLSYRRGGKAN